MNTVEEIYQAFSDYRRTEFGGWPWGPSDIVHPKENRALRQDGRRTQHCTSSIVIE